MYLRRRNKPIFVIYYFFWLLSGFYKAGLAGSATLKFLDKYYTSYSNKVLTHDFFLDTSVPEISSSTVATIKTENHPNEPEAAEQLKKLVEKEFYPVEVPSAPTSAGIYIFFFNLTLGNMC